MSSTSFDSASQPSRGLTAWLIGVVEEGGALLVRLLAYLSGIAMLALIAADLVSGPSVQQPAIDPPAQSGWTSASRPRPAFAVSAADFQNKTESYEILRHPEGGRKDTLRWMAEADSTPVAEIELYRAGDELASFAATGADLTQRMGKASVAELEPAGLVGTKFGKVALWRLPGAAPACLGFTREFDDPRLRISGWSCQADTRAAQRNLIGCTLDRLILLSAGNDPKLAELFARAELKRGDCGTLPSVSADWVNSAETPQLRGRL